MKRDSKMKRDSTLNLENMPALARAMILKKLSCNERLNLLLSGKVMGNMDIGNDSMQDIRNHLENCHIDMAIRVTLWHIRDLGWFVHERSLTDACKQLELQVNEDSYGEDLDNININTFKVYKDTPDTQKNLQIKNGKIFEHTTGLAFKMGAIRYRNKIFPIEQTFQCRSGTSGTSTMFQKIEPDPEIEHDGEYIKCELLLTGPNPQTWNSEYLLSFDPIISNLGQLQRNDGLFGAYVDPIV